MKALVFLILFGLYWTPTIIAAVRSHEVASVAVVNCFLGWTGIGWIVALTMSVRDKPFRDADVLLRRQEP